MTSIWSIIAPVMMTYAIVLLVVTSCSTTSNLPDGEYLYTGIKEIVTEEHITEDPLTEATALEEVKSALAYAPNNSFMGSSSTRIPPPMGLWIYNSFVNDHEEGLKKWLFNTFASTPVTLTSVTPETRVKVATNTLQNYGYFGADVDYRIVDQKDPKKKKLEYTISLGHPYIIDSVHYAIPTTLDSIRKACADESVLLDGSQFNVSNLQAEKDRLVEEFRNNGYYYYRSDYLNYYADSTMNPYKVRVLMQQDPKIPTKAAHRWYNGKIDVYIRDNDDARSVCSDSVTLRNATVHYSGDESPISPKILMRNFRFRKGRLFSQELVDETVENLSNMQIFSQMTFSYIPRDSTNMCDTLDLQVDCVMDKLIDAEFDFDITQKSNSQIGPKATLTVSKRNAFGHGETLSLKGVGSYEWQTGNNGGREKIDSYLAGLDASITYPWLVVPKLAQKRFRYATSSTFKLGFQHLKRAGYYRQLSFTASAEYNFKTNKYYSHKFSPLTLTYNKMEETTARFDSILTERKSLYYSLRDQFIPAMSYTLTYDNNWKDYIDFTTRVELNVKESGNLISGIYALTGSNFSKEDKKLLNVPYAQFLKTTLDVRHIFKLTSKSMFATRFFAGAVWAYGNSAVAPNREQFFVGGANDIRAFAAYSLGPGRYYDSENLYTYLDQVGSMKLAFNAEYRFPLIGDLNGALFLDAGNVWTMKYDSSHPGSKIDGSHFFDDIATGTGFGLRYNLEIIVLRLDMGIALHAPYDTGKSGYYNIRKFWSDGVGIHFAVGYPF